MSNDKPQPRKQIFQPSEERAAAIEQRIEASRSQHEIQEAAERIARQTPRETSIEQLDEVLITAGLEPHRARLLVRAYIEKQRMPIFPCYPHSGARIPTEESRIVSEHLQEAVDRLIKAGASLYTVKLACDGLSSHVSGLMEADKQRKRKAAEEARLKAEAAQQKAAEEELQRDQLASVVHDVVQRANDEDSERRDSDV